jgi:PKD repeat protein
MKYIYLPLILIIFSIESCTNKKVEPIIPVANFTFELGKNGEVKFNNTSQNANSYQWEFGDGEKSIDKNPIHFYKANSSFEISLIVKNEAASSNKKVTINIENYPEIGFVGTLKNNALKVSSSQKSFKLDKKYYPNGWYDFNFSKDSLDFNFGNISGKSTYSEFIKSEINLGKKELSSFLFLKLGLRLLIYNRVNSTYSAIVQYANEENLIELIDVYEETSNCTCDIKSHWLKYKIKGHEIEGILTIKYDNPCCF